MSNRKRAEVEKTKAAWLHSNNSVIAHLPDGKVVASVVKFPDGTYSGAAGSFWLKKEQAIADVQGANAGYEWGE